MNINELTIGDIKSITSMLNQNLVAQEDPFLGQYVIVRSYSAGVFAGTLTKRIGQKILLANCRRLWAWTTANKGISLSEVAVYGINQNKSKICCVETSKLIEDSEISPCSIIARKSIEEAKEYVYEG